MGSWDQTCMVTQVPIPYRTKVKFFMLRGDRWIPRDSQKVDDVGTTTGYCMPTDLWKPLGPPMSGTYDMYGTIENWNDKEFQFQLANQYFKENHNLELGEEVFEKIHSNDGFCLDALVGANNAILKYAYSWAMIPETIYEAVVQTASEMNDFWTGNEKNVRAAVDKSLQTMIESQGLNFDEDRDWKINHQMEVKGGRTYHFLKDSVCHREIFKEAANPENVKAISDFAVFQYFMLQSRNGYMPQFGQGSQDADWTLHKAKAQAAIKYCEQQENREEE